MKILVTGATGLVGSALLPALEKAGHKVGKLVRPGTLPSEGDVKWDPISGAIDSAGIEGSDAVIHLGAENIAEGRWTKEKKRRIRDTRVRGTGLLAHALAELERPPATFVCASAIGFYGDRGSEVVDEESAPGAGFLAEVCKEWEAAAAPAEARGIRVVKLRFGVVLTGAGGALKQMLLPFKLGVGGRLGSGKQYMSWISIEDAVGAIVHCLANASLSGPVNVVAPEAATNAEFTKALGRALRRPTLFPVPAPALKLALGQMADELLLASTRVQPKVLQESGYAFRNPDLNSALRSALG